MEAHLAHNQKYVGSNPAPAMQAKDAVQIRGRGT